MYLNILAIGDTVGKPGRKILEQELKNFISQEQIDFCLVNAENSANGSGITIDIANKLFSYGIDVITMGDHVWKRKEIYAWMNSEKRIIRPANYSPLAHGRGYVALEIAGGIVIGVINLLGRVFMKPIDCPFRAADNALVELSKITKIIIVDMHAEATSEKVAMGWYLDGRVSAVVGTHTHVQTADERIFPGGTGYITDLGMTGPHESVIGRRVDCVLQSIVTQVPVRYDIADKGVRVEGVVLVINTVTGKAEKIKRIKINAAP
ncbi:MAG: TIGR00282 family metallophosphoesterase [Candidatus Scalindua sp. AMX11]|nr:MAG: TIGR00282 family metallophosphoesterase [Candidatus Scalindua sp.]NOG85408.1 TIGR00282 family metallophosphoesterase [Planctomycetota bacterium]RZV84002.1 MAG: TIGR00282 family metallophosphoesterase [Candidatus Scalindua sp. SCAELEC01]TDE65713.1 MAG: TIGR00282 family metallophosphoesterase [Candidatus Scalindua sp. AMX11]GJQ58796.1 MAG: 2',3'-cyclic-nucleotide 2'-phosphodiesterase [Candidatus Scalindua sp.]